MLQSLLTARHARLFCLGLLTFGSACSPGLETLKDERSARGSLGEEVYKVLCRRTAGTELPRDLDGRQTEDLCLGDSATAAAALKNERDTYTPRLLALAERREQIVKAVDLTVPDDLGEELENLMRELLPFYDPPQERIQKSTRALAAFLESLGDDEQALTGLARLGRSGMSPPQYSYGVYRALLGYRDVGKVLSVLLPILSDDKSEVKPWFELMLTGLALELATGEVDDDPDSHTRVLKDLLTRSHPDFAEGSALFTAVRDERGLPLPAAVGNQAVPFPFVDDDNDGLADQRDDFVVADGFKGTLPTPFATRDEPKTPRDEHGRALGYAADGDQTREPLYATIDANNTVLAAALRESGKLFDPKTQIATSLAKVVPALFGERKDTKQAYGKLSIDYEAPDTDVSPIIDVIDGLSATVDRPIYPESLELTKRLLRDHEPAWARALEPLLSLEKRTRSQSDAYPMAKIATDSIFWDELLYEGEKLSRQRRAADGDSALEALMRGTLGYARDLTQAGAPLVRTAGYEALKHQGAVAATLMRFKDEWRSNPASESKRAEGEPGVLGGFRIPVDRDQPDAPVTCGKDGCGGPIAGTLFERWANPGQKCMAQRNDQTGSDCGAPANQSIYHRSLGLIYEMAGRSQCNKVITIGDLLKNSLFKDACANPPSPLTCTGVDAAAKDASCVAGRGADYLCDDARNICVARPGTPTCVALKADQDANLKSTIVETEVALQKSYTCAADLTDPCFTRPYPAAFLDPDGAGVGIESGIQACHMMNLPDVGRTFGRALTHEFTIDVPNPWVYRYLEDTARAGDASLPTCEDFSIKDPRQIPTCSEDNGVGDPCPIGAACVPNAASLSRSVYADDITIYEARYGTTVDTLGELIEFLLDDRSLFQSDEDTVALRPDVNALSRVLFAPAGSSSLLVFDPLLIQGAPQACAKPLPAGVSRCPADDTAEEAEGCCISDITKPPLRYRLDTYYGATTFAWEQSLTFTDGTQLSFIDATKTLADAVNRVDYTPPSVVDPVGQPGDDPKNFESLEYVFSTIGKVVAQHYDSAMNPRAQNKDPSKPMFRYLTNLVSYEPLLADLLDDGMIVDTAQDVISLDGFTAPEQQLGLLYKSFDTLEALDGMDFGTERDGIDVAAALTEHLLSPHAGCTGGVADPRVIAGQGACDLYATGQPGLTAPLRYRSGRQTICWNDGRCFNGQDGQSTRYPSPMYLILDAVKKIDDTIAADPGVDEAFDAARAGLVDAYGAIENDQLKDRRLRALLLVGTDFMLERWAVKDSDGSLAQLRADLTQDMVDLVRGPVFAGGLAMLEGLVDKPAAMDELNGFAFALFTDSEGKENVRSLIVALADLVQALPGDKNTNALLQLLAESILPDAAKSVKTGGGLSAIEDGLTWQNLTISRDTVALDKKDTLAKVLNNLVSSSEDMPYTPLETFLDALTAVHREDPLERGVLSSADWKSVAREMNDVLLDRRRGFERLYDLVQCRNESDSEICE